MLTQNQRRAPSSLTLYASRDETSATSLGLLYDLGLRGQNCVMRSSLLQVPVPNLSPYTWGSVLRSSRAATQHQKKSSWMTGTALADTHSFTWHRSGRLSFPWHLHGSTLGSFSLNWHFHRITEYPKLEGAHKDCRVQLLVSQWTTQNPNPMAAWCRSLFHNHHGLGQHLTAPGPALTQLHAVPSGPVVVTREQSSALAHTPREEIKNIKLHQRVSLHCPGNY